jgi:FixJ family two-component response regulator
MASKQPAPTVFVVDDDPAIREFVKHMSESVGFRVETYSDAHAFLAAYDGRGPACLILDVRMPGMSGFDLQTELGARHITMPILMMSAYAEVPMAVRALKAGAVDFLQKPFDGQTLLDRIQEMIERDRGTCQRHDKETKVARELKRLPPRLQQVLDGLMAGKRNKVIAYELGISPNTVDVHRARLMERLEVDSLADLIRLVLAARSKEP